MHYRLITTKFQFWQAIKKYNFVILLQRREKKQQMLSNVLHNIVSIYVARFKGFGYMGWNRDTSFHILFKFYSILTYNSITVFG